MRRPCSPSSPGCRPRPALRGELADDGPRSPGRFEIEFRLRQKERELEEAVAARQRDPRVEALANDGVVRTGPAGPAAGSWLANRGAADVAIRQVRVEGLEGTVACDLTAGDRRRGRGRAARGAGARGRQDPRGAPVVVGPDQAARCEPTLTIPAVRPGDRAVLASRRRGRAIHVRRRRAFGLPYRPTPFYVQVILGVNGGQRRRATLIAHARSVPLRGEHLQRRETIGVAGRAAVVGPHLAGNRDRADGARRRRWRERRNAADGCDVVARSAGHNRERGEAAC